MVPKRAFRHVLLVFLLAVLLTIASGCATLQDPETSQEIHIHEIAKISSENRFSQTFVSRRNGLNRIYIWLKVQDQEPPVNGKLFIQLYHDLDCKQKLLQQVFHQESFKNNTPLRVDFPPVKLGENQNFCLELTVDSGIVTVLGRNENQYSKGEAAIDGLLIDADAAFRTAYRYGFKDLVEDATNAIKNLLLLVPMILAIWLPGRFLLFISRKDKLFDWGERTALSLGLSLSILVILMVWTTLIKVRWNSYWVWSILLLIAGWFIYMAIRENRKTGIRQLIPGWKKILPHLPLLGVFFLTLGTRLLMVRDLSAPAWVDPVHHALISRIILESGKLPETYEPYITTQTTGYHPGFHVNFAIFEWLSGMDIQAGMLIYGQVLNAAIIFGVYAMAHQMTGNRIAGIFAALIVAVFSPMPAYYTSWGRYTQLAALLILPAAYVFLVRISNLARQKDEGQNHIKSLLSVILGGVFWGGISLTHYRVAFFFLLLIISYLTTEFAKNLFQKHSPHGLFFTARMAIVMMVVGFIFTLPWWPDTLKTLFVPGISWPGASNATPFRGFSWTFLTSAKGTYSLILAGLGFLWAVLRRRNFQWTLLIWIFLMLAIANLYVWKLPGAGFINNTSVTITFFIPIAILSGYVLGWIVRGWSTYVPENWKLATSILLIIILSGVSLWGASSIIGIINPTTILFRQHDLQGINWLSENISQDQQVLINPFSWGYGIYAGADGGFWLSPISGNPTQPPPVLYGLDHTNKNRYTEISQQVNQASADPSKLAVIMRSNQINYIFLGAKGGILSPKSLEASPSFEKLFQENGVSIFTVLPP